MAGMAGVLREAQRNEMPNRLASLWAFRLKAVLVLGPDPFAANDHRELVVNYPDTFRAEATALAHSQAFGPPWRLPWGLLIAWQSLAETPARVTAGWVPGRTAVPCHWCA